MKKYRVNTTISGKHHDILKKHTKEYGTQQSVLEHALERLKKNIDISSELSPEEQLWMRIGSEINDIFTIFPKEFVRVLFETADIAQMEEYFGTVKQAEFAVEWYHNKHLEDCSLKEVLDGLIQNIKMQSTADTLNFRDHGNYYTINMTHRLGINAAYALVIMNESAFKSYGAKFESRFSERSIFFKIYKN